MRPRRVVGGEHSTRSSGPTRGGEVADERLDVLAGYAAWAEDLGRIDRAVDDRALDADRALATVEDRVARGIEQAGEIVEHVCRSGGADLAEAVGRRCDDTATERLEHRCREWVGGHTHGNGVASAGDDIEYSMAAVEQQRERSRPACVCQQRGDCRDVVDPPCEVLERGDMDDQRMVVGSAFHAEDAPDGILVLGVCSEPVDSFGGHRHQPSCSDQARAAAAGSRMTGGVQASIPPP